MRSDGGLTDVAGFSGLKSICESPWGVLEDDDERISVADRSLGAVSGPAGGVVGFALTSWEKGGRAVIGLDMVSQSFGTERPGCNVDVRLNPPIFFFRAGWDFNGCLEV